jgi:hypothetical protein
MLSMSPRDKRLRPGRGDTRRSTLLLRPVVAADRGIELPRSDLGRTSPVVMLNTEGLAVMSAMASA